MTTQKVSVSLEEPVASIARRLAEIEGLSLSAWLSRAAAREAKLIDGRLAAGEWRAEYESEHGPVPDAVREQVHAELTRLDQLLADPGVLAAYDTALATLREPGDPDVSQRRSA